MYRAAPILIFVLGASVGLAAGVVVDRMAVIVGKHVVKSSDIERDVRLTGFLNHEPLKSDIEARRKAAERLIDQEIIRQEIIAGGFRRPPESEALPLEAQVRQDQFGGSEARLREALVRYSITEDELREHLLWQLTVLQFVEQRFRLSTAVSDEEVRAYYDQHLAELRRENPKDSSYETLAAKVRTSLEGERVNQNFTEWLDQNRKRYRIEYREEAFK